MGAKTAVVRGVLPNKDGGCAPKQNCDCSMEELLPISCNSTADTAKRVPVISCDNQNYRLEDFTQLVEAVIAASSLVAPPIGSIIPFDGDVTTPGPNFDPTGLGLGSCIGWALCNGSNGTPDLVTNNRGLLSFGGLVANGSTGGNNQITLSGAQSGIQAHSVSITDPGHSHAGSQASHSHTLTTDPHNHGVTDTGHDHTGSAAAHTHGVTDTGHIHGITDPGHGHTYGVQNNANTAVGGQAGRGDTINANNFTDGNTTGITINSATTGITINSASPAATINSNTTGVTINNASVTGSTSSATPTVTVNSNTTGITASVAAAPAVTPIDMRSAYYALGFIKRLF